MLGNVLLLGALLTIMVRPSFTFLHRHHSRAGELGYDVHPDPTVSGTQGQGAGILDFSLSRRQFWQSQRSTSEEEENA